MESRPELKRHVKSLYGDDLVALEDAANAVERLMGDPAWSIVAAMVSQQSAAVAAEVGRDATLLEHPLLTHRLGQLEGVRTFEDSAQALLDHYRVVVEEQRAKHEATAGSGA